MQLMLIYYTALSKPKSYILMSQINVKKYVFVVYKVEHTYNTYIQNTRYFNSKKEIWNMVYSLTMLSIGYGSIHMKMLAFHTTHYNI